MKRPAQMTSEGLAEAFMNIIRERYPSSEKVLQQLVNLGCDNVETKIVAITQLRDAVREVSLPKIFRSVAHRDEVYAAIIEAAEELEDQLEDKLDKMREEED